MMGYPYEAAGYTALSLLLSSEILIVLSDLRSDGILPGSLSETHHCMQERLKLYESQCVLRAM